MFLYFDLAGDGAVVERGRRVQDIVTKMVGLRNFNPAPEYRLHSTILTDYVARHERLGGDAVRRVVEAYGPLCRDLPPCLVAVLGPYLTPGGGVILECRVHEPGLVRLRESARRLAGERGGNPRIPSIEYAMLGYLRLELLEPLPRLDPLPREPGSDEGFVGVLLLVLADGQECLPTGGATTDVAGERYDYECPDGRGYGEPDTRNPVWTISYRAEGASRLIPVEVATVYQ